MILPLISDLHKVETFHGPPQITITSGALEELKRGSLGLVVMDEEHTDKHPSGGGRRGAHNPQLTLLWDPRESMKIELTPGQAPMRIM